MCWERSLLVSTAIVSDRQRPSWMHCHTGRRWCVDVVAVAELTDPVGAIAREMPRALHSVASDRHVVAITFDPPALRCCHVRTADSCKQSQHTSSTPAFISLRPNTRFSYSLTVYFPASPTETRDSRAFPFSHHIILYVISVVPHYTKTTGALQRQYVTSILSSRLKPRKIKKWFNCSFS